MSFNDLIKNRWSVRSFKSDKIEPQKLADILEAGRLAPTAKNNQPQRIYVIKSEDALNRINSVCRCIFGAPVVLAIGYDKAEEWQNPLKPGCHSGETDAAIVCTHMMLAAADAGLGSCWVGFFNPDEVSKALDIPENVVLTALMPIGYPADGAAPSERHALRRPLSETVTEL